MTTIEPMINHRILTLIGQGVIIPAPLSVEIDDDVDLSRISSGVTLHRGTRISGGDTWLAPGVTLGEEAPATVVSCQMGPGSSLKGGYAKKAVFLKGASAGSGAHIREGSIFDEEASCAHTVGLKQTILLPFVTLGSLINFCDVLMTGGTNRKDHSEVGSSYIHFNYTPNQDKATASLLGNIPQGVMLDQPPIFLGGQGGLVGPCQLTFGTVVAAGTIMRKDEDRPKKLHFGGASRAGSVSASSGIYQNVKRIASHNIHYMGNLLALWTWTCHIRRCFIGPDYPEALYESHLAAIDMAIKERVKRFKGFVEKLPASLEAAIAKGALGKDTPLAQQKHELIAGVESFEENLLRLYAQLKLEKVPDSFAVEATSSAYIAWVKALDKTQKQSGTQWLKSIVTRTETMAADLFPLTLTS